MAGFKWQSSLDVARVAAGAAAHLEGEMVHASGDVTIVAGGDAISGEVAAVAYEAVRVIELLPTDDEAAACVRMLVNLGHTEGDT